MSDSNKKTDDQKFNETVKRMLRTPPKPHDQSKKRGDVQDKPDKTADDE